MNFIFARLFPWPFLLAGLFTMKQGLENLSDAKESLSWPSVEGVIMASEMDRDSSSDGTTYNAEIQYDYTVTGTLYSSNRVTFGEVSTSDSGDAREILNKYPKGAKVEVFYRSDEPKDSVLETGVKTKTYFLPVFGLVFFLAGLAMLIFLPRAMRKAREGIPEETDRLRR